MATPTEFARDWVFNVIKPFLTQLKNRLGNIRVVALAGGVYRFYNAENQTTDIQGVNVTPVNGVNIFTPIDARGSANGSNTGRLVIKYPFEGGTNTMAFFTLKVYLYRTNWSFAGIFGGYNYYTNHWYNVTAKRLSNVPNDFKQVEFVRFLKDGGDPDTDADYTQFGFIIGVDENITWSYPKVAITQAVLGHQAYDYDRWATGWSLDILQDNEIPPHKVDYTRNM